MAEPQQALLTTAQRPPTLLDNAKRFPFALFQYLTKRRSLKLSATDLLYLTTMCATAPSTAGWIQLEQASASVRPSLFEDDNRYYRPPSTIYYQTSGTRAAGSLYYVSGRQTPPAGQPYSNHISTMAPEGVGSVGDWLPGDSQRYELSDESLNELGAGYAVVRPMSPGYSEYEFSCSLPSPPISLH